MRAIQTIPFAHVRADLRARDLVEIALIFAFSAATAPQVIGVIAHLITG